jgi:hypothetical protein
MRAQVEKATLAVATNGVRAKISSDGKSRKTKPGA